MLGSTLLPFKRAQNPLGPHHATQVYTTIWPRHKNTSLDPGQQDPHLRGGGWETI